MEKQGFNDTFRQCEQLLTAPATEARGSSLRSALPGQAKPCQAQGASLTQERCGGGSKWIPMAECDPFAFMLNGKVCGTLSGLMA